MKKGSYEFGKEFIITLLVATSILTGVYLVQILSITEVILLVVIVVPAFIAHILSYNKNGDNK